ncbi:MAG TPA: DUF4232 domain-containing protein [Candidatus Saccharimonadales bacterium]
MDNSNLNTNTTVKAGSHTKRFILWTLILILTLAIGGAGGYFLGMTNKNQEVQLAKAEGEDEVAAANARAEAEKKKAEEQAKSPTKTVTEASCNADELSLSVSQNSGSGAGTLSYDLILTNISKRSCALWGYPGVSLVNNNGNQIGSPAERDLDAEEKKLTLAPNSKVKSAIKLANSSNFEAGECKEGATKFRVYPPNDTGYLSVALPPAVTAWCPGFEVTPVVVM